jgi:monothiol glutaredoxin
LPATLMARANGAAGAAIPLTAHAVQVVGVMQANDAPDINDKIRKTLSAAPVVLFMKGTPDFPQCGFSAQTVAVLQRLGARFHPVNIFEDDQLREGLKRFSNWPTYPQLYINGELVGGCDIAMEMYRNGELKQLLESAGAVTAAAS